MATVETATVTLTVNGREVTVAKGLSLVEAAAEAGIEIPVFCYEPRPGSRRRRLPHVPVRDRGHAEAPDRGSSSCDHRPVRKHAYR